MHIHKWPQYKLPAGQPAFTGGAGLRTFYKQGIDELTQYSTNAILRGAIKKQTGKIGKLE